MTEQHKKKSVRIEKLKELLELMKAKNTDGRITEACTRLSDIIQQEESDDDSNPGGTPPPPPGGSGR